MLASLLHFNRYAGWDDWAPYFFGSYALGALAWWAARSPQPMRWLGLLAAVGVLALVIDWRTRIALALGVALLLGVMHWRGHTGRSLPAALVLPLHALGRTSYALFLVHFPVLMLANALYARLGLDGPLAGMLMLLLGWAGSMALAFVFERRVEAPLGRWIRPR
jgi:peptidoglycan/LPS O-acetylase OafA/YrhL